MIRGAELPGIGEEDGDHITRLYIRRYKAAGDAGDDICIFGKGNAPLRLARCINDGGELTKALGGAGHEIVNEDPAGIGV